jgi:hypothetical protein
MGLNIHHAISPFLTGSLGGELKAVAGRRSFVFFVRAY